MLLVVGGRPAEAVEGGGAFNVTNNTTNDYTPSYSPGGEKIVYRGGAARSDGVPNDIYTINVNGTGRFNVTDDTTEERDPSYSPDGQKIAYEAWDGQDWEIYTINPNGGERVQITDNTTDEMELSYSPDGQKIAYEGYDGQDTEIYTIDLGPERTVVQVTNNSTHETDPSYSPDGQKIAYAGSTPGRGMEIYTINANGGESTRITDNTTPDTELCWSPDGRKIAYKGVDTRYGKEDTEIYTITVGSARRVGQVTHNLGDNGEPSYSPDGQEIAYEGKDGQDKEIYTSSIPPPPANDDFASARVLSGFSASANGRNTGATLQGGDPPLVDTKATGHTVWYRWTAPFSGSVEMNTCTAAFDTLLGVYSESSPGALKRVAVNDDGCVHGSKVRFNATKNATYKILVDGFNGQQGTFALRVIDKTPPKVTSITPANNAARVAPGANAISTFSEAMRPNTIGRTAFKLYKKGSTKSVRARVSYNATSHKAMLNPARRLSTATTYRAVVSTTPGDLAGNRIDQNKVWYFTTRR